MSTEPNASSPGPKEGDIWAKVTPAAVPSDDARALPASEAPKPPTSESQSISHGAIPTSSSSRASATAGAESAAAAATAKIKRIREKERKAIGVLGFSSSGKTVYLSMLYHATQERRLFPPEWHANWAIDDGYSRGYLARMSRMMRGVDRRGRIAYVDSTRTAVRREFPRGNVEVTPIEFELYRRWGLTNRPLKVFTQDGMGEAIHNAASDGPTNLPVEQRAIWQTTLDLCKRSEALLLFVNLVKFQESDYTSDVSFLLDWLLREGMKPKVVAIVAPGLDAWDGIKNRDELRAMLREQFAHTIESLARANIACEVFPVSSVGKNFIRQSDQVGPGSTELGQLINPDPRAEPKPEYVAEPWEYIFQKTLPRWAQFEPVAILVDSLWLLRRWLLNRYTVIVYAALLIGFGIAQPWLQGRADFAELQQVSAQATGIAQIEQAARLYDRLLGNGVWHRLNAAAVASLASDRERWAALLEIEQLRRTELPKAHPDYVALVKKVADYQANPAYERPGAALHPYLASLPMAEWRAAAAEAKLRGADPLPEKLRYVLEYYRAYGAKADPSLAAEGARQLEAYRLEKERIYGDIKDPQFADFDFIELGRAEVGELRQLAGQDVFIGLANFQQIKTDFNELNRTLTFLSAYAKANKDAQGLRDDKKLLTLAHEIEVLPERYLNLRHPLLQECRGRGDRMRERYKRADREKTLQTAMSTEPAAILTDESFPQFLNVLGEINRYLEQYQDSISPDERNTLRERRDQVLTALQRKLETDVTELESKAKALAEDTTLADKRPATAQELRLRVNQCNEAYRKALGAGLPVSASLDQRLFATAEFILVFGSPLQTAEDTRGVGRKLEAFASSRTEPAILVGSARLLAGKYLARADELDASERLAALADPAAEGSERINGASEIAPIVSKYNGFLAERRFESQHATAISRREVWLKKFNDPTNGNAYYDALQGVLDSRFGSPAVEAAAITLARYFVDTWKDDRRVARVQQQIDRLTLSSRPTVTLALNRLEFPRPYTGVVEFVVSEGSPGSTRELARLTDLAVVAGKLGSPVRLALQPSSTGSIRFTATLRTKSGGPASVSTNGVWTQKDLQPGVVKVGLLDDAQTVIGYQILGAQ